MVSEAVEFNISKGVATIRLNQPDQRNPLSEEITSEFIRIMNEIPESSARCVVVEGAGSAFSAGGDIDAMKQRLDDGVDVEEVIHHIKEESGRMIIELFRCPIPTITKIDGPAIGGGANLAIASDIQLASEEAKIGFGFRNVGLGVDTGTTYFLERLTGLNKAKELVFTGKVVDAEKAAELGLVNHVFPSDDFEDRCEEIITQIAQGPTIALSTSKEMMNERPGSIEAAISQEANAQSAILTTDDHREGVMGFLERRDPEFSGK